MILKNVPLFGVEEEDVILSREDSEVVSGVEAAVVLEIDGPVVAEEVCAVIVIEGDVVGSLVVPGMTILTSLEFSLSPMLLMAVTI